MKLVSYTSVIIICAFCVGGAEALPRRVEKESFDAGVVGRRGGPRDETMRGIHTAKVNPVGLNRRNGPRRRSSARPASTGFIRSSFTFIPRQDASKGASRLSERTLRRGQSRPRPPGTN